MTSRWLAPLLAAAALPLLAALPPAALAQQAPPPPAVGVIKVERQPMIEQRDFIGRIQATDRVDLVARVTAVPVTSERSDDPRRRDAWPGSTGSLRA